MGYDFQVESMPDGEGQIFTDGVTLWREKVLVSENEVSDIEPTLESIVDELSELIVDQECRLISLELGVQ